MILHPRKPDGSKSHLHDARGQVPGPSDPRWLDWAELASQEIRYTLGDRNTANAQNASGKLVQLADGFLNTRICRPDRTPLELKAAILKWDGYGRSYTKPTASRKDGVFVSGCVLKDDSDAPNPCTQAHHKKNFVNMNASVIGRMLAYDVDNTDGVKRIDGIRQRLIEKRLAFNICSTHSNTAENEKARVVVYTDQEVLVGTEDEREIYSLMYNLIGAELFDDAHDKTCRNAARVIYMPSYNGKTPIFSYFEPGGPLLLAPYLESARAKCAEAKEAIGRGNFQHPAIKLFRLGGAHHDHETPWLAKLLAKFAKRLNAGKLVEHYCTHAKRGKRSDNGVTADCFNCSAHTEGRTKPDDLLAYDAQDSRFGLPALSCFHDSCQVSSPEMLDIFIQTFGIPLRALLQYIEGITDDERATMLVPDGFAAEGGYIHGFKRMKSDGGETASIAEPVCSTLIVTGETRDELSGSWGREIEFTNRDGNIKRVVATAELLYGDGSHLFTTLGAAGLWIGEDKWARGKLKQLLNGWRTDERITEFSMPGWHGDVYVTPLGEVVGKHDGTYRLRSGVSVEDSNKRGTLQGWKDGVGHAVWKADTPQFALGVLTGAAGVFVQAAELDTIGFHYMGKSGSGKTIAQICGASCVANAKPGFGVLITANATPNALEGKFEMGSGSSVHFDEAKTGEAKHVEKMIFMAASGIGKGRMRHDTTLRKSKVWSTCWTFSSEKSLASMLQGANGQMVTGGVVRLMTIPFNSCPMIEKARADAIKRAARAHSGWALPVVVAEVQRQGLHDDPAQLLARIDAYAAKLPTNGGSDTRADTVAAERARQAFGVLWLVGEIMQTCKLIPAEADIGSVIRWAWSSYIGGAEMLEPKAVNVRAIETYLRSNVGVTVFKTYPDQHDPHPHHEAVAWYDEGKVYLRADKIESIPGVTLSRAEAVDALKGAGLLICPPPAAKGLVHQKVPGHGRVPNYRLSLTLVPITVADHLDMGAENVFVAAGAAGGVH